MIRRGDLQFFIAAGKAALWLLLAPFTVVRWLCRWTVRVMGGWILATTDSLPCPGCGGDISLVGRWECGACHYTFDGFYFSPCFVCGAVPSYLQCQCCKVGIKNPAHFGK